MSEADVPACRGVLKLCDMGLARFFKPENAAYTPRVVTLWCASAHCSRLGCIRWNGSATSKSQ
jgi:hypothetical protein